MASRTLPADDTARTVAAIDHAIAFEPGHPMLFGGAGSGKSRPPFVSAVDALLGNAMLRAAVQDLRADRDRLADAYTLLLTAAQAAVIEARTGRRNPVTPILEALTDLGQLPGDGARLHALIPETAAAWPKGAEE